MAILFDFLTGMIGWSSSTGTTTTVDGAMLFEDADYMLLENGDYMLYE